MGMFGSCGLWWNTDSPGLLQAVQNYRRLMRRGLLYTAAGVATGVALYFSVRWVQSRPSKSSGSISAAEAATDINRTLLNVVDVDLQDLQHP